MASTTQTPAATKATGTEKKDDKLNLEEQMTFYGQYHSNKVNVAIHIICVPLIFWTVLVLSNLATGLRSPLPSFDLLGQEIKLTSGLITALGYATYFVLLDPVAGTLYFPILVAEGLGANYFVQNVPNALSIGLSLHVFAWIAQFVGHFKFEGRAPALFDSLMQSLVLAVFFVFLEVLFAFGYRRDFHKRLQNRIGKEILAFRRGQKAKGGKHDPSSVTEQTVWRP